MRRLVMGPSESPRRNWRIRSVVSSPVAVLSRMASNSARGATFSIRPLSSIAIRSAIRNAESISCVTTTLVTLSFLDRSMIRSSMAAEVTGSSPADGSS